MSTYNKPAETDRLRTRRNAIRFWVVILGTLAGAVMYWLGLIKESGIQHGHSLLAQSCGLPPIDTIERLASSYRPQGMQNKRREERDSSGLTKGADASD